MPGNLPLRGRIRGGPIRPEELPHLVMIRLQHGNGIFRAAPCLVTRGHDLLLRLLYVQRPVSHRERQGTAWFSRCCSLLLQALCQGNTADARLVRADPGDTGILRRRRDCIRGARLQRVFLDMGILSSGGGATSAGGGRSSRVAL